MNGLRHILTAVVLAVVLRWLWLSSMTEKARFQSGRNLFPPTRAIRLLTFSLGMVFAVMVIWASYSLHRPDEWWVPYLFLLFLALVPFMYPPTLTIEVDGIASRSWFGGEKKIRWEEVAFLKYNTGNNQFSVVASNGCKITHGGFNVDMGAFQAEVLKRARVPLKIARPGMWKTETTEVPYEDRYEETEGELG